MARIALLDHAMPQQCGFRDGSWADGDGIPSAVSRSAIASRPARCELIEDPADHCGCGLVDRQSMEPFAVSSFGRLGVRPGVGEFVAARRSSAEEPPSNWAW